MTHEEKIKELARWIREASNEKWSCELYAAGILAKVKSMYLTDKPAIVGELVAVGTCDFYGEKVTGIVVAMTPDEIRAIRSIPMYRRVSVCDVEDSK